MSDIWFLHALIVNNSRTTRRNENVKNTYFRHLIVSVLSFSLWWKLITQWLNKEKRVKQKLKIDQHSIATSSHLHIYTLITNRVRIMNYPSVKYKENKSYEYTQWKNTKDLHWEFTCWEVNNFTHLSCVITNLIQRLLVIKIVTERVK